MKIVVLVPSSEYISYAGARIRYGRIAPALAQAGGSLTLQDLGEFDPDHADADVFIFSKCHDARALVAAAVLAERGCAVGVDLFDDYFSQLGDSRLSRYRNWLAQIVEICTFALCSTDAMGRIVSTYRPDLPVHVMNDPAPAFDMQQLAEILDRKLRAVRQSAQMVVAWFGVGDNPHFPVGLHDLAGFSGELRKLARGALDVQLRVLTNDRALSADRLSQLQKLPVTTTVSEWTEDRERELLDEAFVAFLPVNLQSFSTAKSLNRAVTALCSGCQVLSAGFPLYRQLDTLVYRDPHTLLDDIAKGPLRHSSEGMANFAAAMETSASPEIEAGRLMDFLQGLQVLKVASDTLVLVHGHATTGHAHKLVQSNGGLSVASPYCTAKLGFDVIFELGLSGLRMFVSEKASKRLLADAKSRIIPGPAVSGRKFIEVNDPDGRAARPGKRSWGRAPVPFQLATYTESMRGIRARLADAFGPCRMLLSETSPLPFPPVEY